MTWTQHPKSKYTKVWKDYLLTGYLLQDGWMYVLYRGEKKIGQGRDAEKLKAMARAGAPMASTANACGAGTIHRSSGAG